MERINNVDTNGQTDQPVLRETFVDVRKKLPERAFLQKRFSPVRLFADQAFAARMWFAVACCALGFCVLQPYFILRAYRTRERVVVLDAAGTFSVSPILGFEEARDLHEAMALWGTLALLQRNPRDFDFPDVLEKLFLEEAFRLALQDRDDHRDEFQLKSIHQKPEIFKIDILQTRENTVLVKVEGQLVRTGAFERQSFVESPRFTLNLTLVRNPNMIVNKRYPLGVWKFEYRLG